MRAAILNFGNTGDNTVFLTLLGGGSFGNREDWIFSAIDRAVHIFSDMDLNVILVSFGSSKPRVQELVEAW